MADIPCILVTISRQFGSGGAYIGQAVAKRLGYKYIDREILSKAARYLGQEEEALSGREERVGGFWENFFNAFSGGIPEAGYVPPAMRPVYDRDLFDAEAMIINEMADMHNAVIVGRCGFHVLKERPGVANVFIHAPKDFRIRRAMEMYKIPAMEDAVSLVDEMDRERSNFIRAMTGADWTDARNYHVAIDIGRAGFATAEEMILRLAESVKRGLGL